MCKLFELELLFIIQCPVVLQQFQIDYTQFFLISNNFFGEGLKLLNFGHFEAFGCLFHRVLLLN